jgi:hypothetical protein
MSTRVTRKCRECKTSVTGTWWVLEQIDSHLSISPERPGYVSGTFTTQKYQEWTNSSSITKSTIFNCDRCVPIIKRVATNQNIGVGNDETGSQAQHRGRPLKRKIEVMTKPTKIKRLENTNVDVIVVATNEKKEVEEETRKRKGVEGKESSDEVVVLFNSFMNVKDETKKSTNPYKENKKQKTE